MEDQFNSNPATGYGESAGTAARMKEEVASKANEAKDKIADFGRKAADRIDAQREPVADSLNKTASALHEQGDNAAGIAHRTADKLEATADYVREHDLKAMMTDVQDLARRYPGQSLAVAAAVGFLVGRLFRKAD
jgi:ElaB/YqjD/DUF883 family membrane-anchored ribosome-binding protein